MGAETPRPLQEQHMLLMAEPLSSVMPCHFLLLLQIELSFTNSMPSSLYQVTIDCYIFRSYAVTSQKPLITFERDFFPLWFMYFPPYGLYIFKGT